MQLARLLQAASPPLLGQCVSVAPLRLQLPLQREQLLVDRLLIARGLLKDRLKGPDGRLHALLVGERLILNVLLLFVQPHALVLERPLPFDSRRAVRALCGQRVAQIGSLLPICWPLPIRRVKQFAVACMSVGHLLFQRVDVPAGRTEA